MRSSSAATDRTPTSGHRAWNPAFQAPSPGPTRAAQGTQSPAWTRSSRRRYDSSNERRETTLPTSPPAELVPRMCGQDKIFTIPIVIVTTPVGIPRASHHITTDAEPLDVIPRMCDPFETLLRDETRPHACEKTSTSTDSMGSAKAPRSRQRGPAGRGRGGQWQGRGGPSYGGPP